MSLPPEPHREPYGMNKQVFLPEDRVRLADHLTGGEEVLGNVIGVASRNIIDMYIVLLDKPFGDNPWRAFVLPSVELVRA